MLVRNKNSKYCFHSWAKNGECCCNCKFRYTLYVHGIPMGNYCGVNFDEEHPDNVSMLVPLSMEAHSMCEMHMLANKEEPFVYVGQPKLANHFT